MTKKLDYKKMIKAVDKIMQTDFMFEMDCKSMPNPTPFTQEEAEKMRDELMKIYTISHCVSCTACNNKYLIKKKT